MNTQISRLSDQPHKHYSGVMQQQGRMLLDADNNELNEIIKRRVRDALRDIIGYGTPDDRGVLRQNSAGTWALHWGRLYADGHAANLQPDPNLSPAPEFFDIEKQADFPLSESPDLPSEYMLYADIWERVVTSLEDDALLDPALAGADTATRMQTMAQIKWAPAGTDPTNADTNPQIGTAELSITVRDSIGAADACDPCAEELSLNVDVGSYLFRVELHDVTNDGSGNTVIVLKWSSENAAEQFLVGDEPPGYAADDWVYERFSGSPNYESEKHLGVHLADGFAPARGTLSKGYPTSMTEGTPIRRWDGYCRLIQSGAGWALLDQGGDGGGSDRGIDLSDAAGDSVHGRVRSAGGAVSINGENLAITIDLSGKRIVAGDYWLVPVRGAIHSGGDTIVSAKLPDGILHRYLPLATVSADGTLTPWDLGACKPFDFPPLTNLTARDICYNPGDCIHTEATNVQEALTAVCQANDVADHNRHLHGCGNVCGHKIHCAGPNEQVVRATPGYTVLSDGTALRTADDAIVDVVKLASDTDLLDGDGSGIVVLHIARAADGTASFGVTPDYERPNRFTIWQDFLKKCIHPIVGLIETIWKDMQSLYAGAQPDGDNPLTIAFFNLFCQTDPFNIPGTQHVYLSANEHALLSKIYEESRAAMSSRTHCIHEDVRVFPDYPFASLGMDTVIGWGAHTRVRTFATQANDVNRMVFTCGGASDTVNVYKDQKLIAALQVKGMEGLTVHDVAVSRDGKHLYAVATRGDDTLLSWATIDHDRFEWTNTVNICDFLIKTIIPHPESEVALFGAALGRGVVLLRPDAMIGAEEPQPDIIIQCLAAGHLVYDRVNRSLCATAKVERHVDYMNGEYDGVCWRRIGSNQSERVFTWPGRDGLTDAVFKLPGDDTSANRGGFCIAIDPRAESATEKQILVFLFDPSKNNYVLANGDRPIRVADTTLGLGFHFKSNRLLVTLDDEHKLLVIDPKSPAEAEWTELPAQVGPIGVAMTGGAQEFRAAVLNNRSNTLTLIDADLLPKPNSLIEGFTAYRAELISVFEQITSHVIEALRDCFCDLLLDCTVCENDEFITLARIEITGGTVDHICNLSRRKFLHTWPKMQYWLSTIGLFGTVGRWISKFCCPEDDDWISNVVHNPLATAGSVISYTGINNGAQFRVYQQGFANRKRTTTGTIKPAWNQSGRLVADGIREWIAPSVNPTAAVAPDALINTPTDDAKAILANRGVAVGRILEYDPASGADKFFSFGLAAPTLSSGANVNLYQRDGRVVYYERTPAAAMSSVVVVDETAEEIRKLEVRRDQLKSQIDDVSSKVVDIESTRGSIEEGILRTKADLEAIVAKRTELLSEVESVRTDIETLKSTRTSLADDVTSTRADVESVAAIRTALIADVETVRSEIESLRQVRESLAQEIRTVRDEVAELENRRGEIANDFAEEAKELRAKLDKYLAPFNTVDTLQSVNATRAKALRRRGVHFVGQVDKLEVEELAEILGGNVSVAKQIKLEANRLTDG